MDKSVITNNVLFLCNVSHFIPLFVTKNKLAKTLCHAVQFPKFVLYNTCSQGC